MTKYKFEQFDEPINCESWRLRTINLETSSLEIILTDTNGQEYSHTFNNIMFLLTTVNEKCETLLKEYEI